MALEKDLLNIVADEVEKVVKQQTFTEWLNDQDKLQEGHIAINNSFLFREDIKTSKNSQFLCVPVSKDGKLLTDQLSLVSKIRFNNLFHYLSPKDKNAVHEKMDTAISSALSTFGILPFILIGTILDNVKVESRIDHDLFNLLVLDPTHTELLSVNEKSVFVREADDEEAIWNALEAACGAAKIAEPPLPLDLQQPFAKAISQVRSESRAVVSLPDGKKDSGDRGLLDEIVKVLKHQIKECGESLERCKGDASKNPDDFNNVLRISYNFSSDATKVLQLLMSLCDLKPILFWSTLAQWFALSESFQNLPWSKSTNKPSLAAYHAMVGGARNRSFHNLFPFSKTLKVPLEGVPLEAISLTFFSEYGGRKNSNRFEYQDQALVEAFTEFTRAGEKFVPFSFWSKNLEVMSRTVRLLETTIKALRLLSKIQNKKGE